MRLISSRKTIGDSVPICRSIWDCATNTTDLTPRRAIASLIWTWPLALDRLPPCCLATPGPSTEYFSRRSSGRTETNTTDVKGLINASPLKLTNGFPPPSGNTVTNNFAVNPSYRLGYVHIWNLDIQREFPGGVVMNAGYNGAKGTRLDTERALMVSGGQPFVYESSEGNSILHAASVRVRKRMAKGLGLSGQYVFLKSIDDASSIGGGGSVVAQDPFDISADREIGRASCRE